MGQDVDTSQGEEMENNIQKDNLKQQIVLKEQEEGRIAELNSIGSIKRKQTNHRQRDTVNEEDMVEASTAKKGGAAAE